MVVIKTGYNFFFFSHGQFLTLYISIGEELCIKIQVRIQILILFKIFGFFQSMSKNIVQKILRHI